VQTNGQAQDARSKEPQQELMGLREALVEAHARTAVLEARSTGLEQQLSESQKRASNAALAILATRSKSILVPSAPAAWS
jgi:hypothetical protein